jgi:HEAT repeat protein
MAFVTFSVCGMDGARLELAMRGQATVKDLKSLIEAEWHIPVICQCVSVNDVVLQDADELVEYSVNDGMFEAALVVDHHILYKRLGDKSSTLRNEASETLQRWAQHDCQRTVALSASCLADSDPLVRRGGVRSITEIAPQGDEFAISCLSGCVDDTDAWVRAAVVESFGMIARKGDKHVAACVSACLEDADIWVRREAAEALRKIALKGNSGAISALREAIRREPHGSSFAKDVMVNTYERLAGNGFPKSRSRWGEKTCQKGWAVSHRDVPQRSALRSACLS